MAALAVLLVEPSLLSPPRGRGMYANTIETSSSASGGDFFPSHFWIFHSLNSFFHSFIVDIASVPGSLRKGKKVLFLESFFLHITLGRGLLNLV